MKRATNTHNLKVWLNALRSGNFKQGVGTLARRSSEGDMEFCCLGVGCVKADIKPKDVRASGVASYQGDYATMQAMPPAEFYRWLGFEQCRDGQGIYVERSGRYVEVATLNDEGMSFAEIADLIEWHGVWIS